MIRPCTILLLLAAGTAALADDLESDAIRYSETTPDNVLSRFESKLAGGEAELRYDEDFGWLRSLLTELDVPESSQTLVFSKTSLQRSRIAPRTPRALYFNDDVYVGYCQQGDVIEVSAVDPRLGTAFYTLDQTNRERPEFTRQTDSCLICHASSHTGGLPGHVVRSVYPDAGGQPLLASGTFRTDHTSPLAERWGGWYVTGTHGDQTHLGNMILKNPAPRRDEIDNSAGMNVTDLADRFRTSAYPTPHSDIVALMVLEHQTTVHNAIVAANLRTREALWYENALDEAFDEAADELRESTLRRIENAGERLVECLLLSGEAPLTAPIAGTATFAEEFTARGPFDDRGRSLRQLDLRTRLFRYPCSYLVHSESFDALPTITREYVLRRLHEVLTGEDRSEPFAHLTDDDRRSILEILRATKTNLPAYWNARTTGDGPGD
jgi:hypothetical protein